MTGRYQENGKRSNDEISNDARPRDCSTNTETGMRA